MDKESALNFLRAHQPMPDTDENDCEELIAEWERVCDYFIENPCIEALPLFLGSFGGGDGYEVYQHFEEFVGKLDPDEATPYFVEALSSSSLPIRVQAADASISLESKDPAYYDLVLSRVEDDNEDEEVRMYCSTTFSVQGQNEFFDATPFKKRVEAVLAQTTDEEIKFVFSELLDFMNNEESDE